jgi:Domain of unknown function (DUF4191)
MPKEKKKPVVKTPKGGGKSGKSPAESMGRVEQVKRSFELAREYDKRIGWKMLGIFLGVIALGVVVGLLIGHPIYCTLLSVSLGLLGATFYFGRKVTSAVNIRLESQVGGGAGALQGLRRGWTVDPGIAATRNSDMVHRAVGPAGIVLVGEGMPSRVGHLLSNEKRKHSRVTPDTPIYDIVVGNGTDQVPIKKLMGHVAKLPRNLTGAQVSEVKRRLKALESTRQQVPLPKGPMPKNVKLPKAPVRDSGNGTKAQSSGPRDSGR